KEIAPRTMSAVIVRRWRFDRQIHEAEIFVDGDLGPDSGISIFRPRSVFPCFIAELTWPWNGVESPQLFSGAHIERTYQAFRVVVSGNGRAFTHRRTDYYCVLDDNRRGVNTDFSSF